MAFISIYTLIVLAMSIYFFITDEEETNRFFRLLFSLSVGLTLVMGTFIMTHTDFDIRIPSNFLYLIFVMIILTLKYATIIIIQLGVLKMVYKKL